VIVAATGLLTVAHQNIQDLAARLIEHSHLNPASKYPQIFIDAAGRLQDTRVVLLALGAAVYSLVRLAEAYGLYREKAWAEVLAAASAAIYMPIEIYEWFHHPTWFRAGIFVINVAVVAVMLLALYHRRQARSAIGQIVIAIGRRAGTAVPVRFPGIANSGGCRNPQPLQVDLTRLADLRERPSTSLAHEVPQGIVLPRLSRRFRRDWFELQAPYAIPSLLGGSNDVVPYHMHH